MPARSYKPAKASSGFTLLELMVTIVVFVVLAALAVPGLSTYMEKSRLRGAADDVVNQLAQARQVAVKYDRSVSVATTGSGATWCLGAREAATPAAGDQAAAAAWKPTAGLSASRAPRHHVAPLPVVLSDTLRSYFTATWRACAS